MSAAVRAGYKQAEVGVIPQDWGVQPIGELATVRSGGTPSREIQSYWNGAIPWITTSQIDFNTISEAEQFITEDGLKNSAAKLLPTGTLLMALYGQGKTRGKVGVLDFEAATNQACASISLHGNVSREFLLHFLTSRYEAIRNSSNSGGQENLSGQIVKDIPVAIPPLPEQRAIATALSDVDALLAKLEALIAKKRDLKVAAMQQLLTGQTRLPGFSGEWEVKRLGDLANLYQPVTISAYQFTASGYPVYGANGVVGFFGEFNHESPQVTVTCRGSTCGAVNRTVARSWITGNAMVVNCDQSSGLIKDFLYYLLLNQDLSICITGSGQPQIVRGPLANFELPLPCDLTEQAAIASILSDMDTELTSLESRRDKTRAIKQGMMQELLTGRIRLV